MIPRPIASDIARRVELGVYFVDPRKVAEAIFQHGAAETAVRSAVLEAGQHHWPRSVQEYGAGARHHLS